MIRSRIVRIVMKQLFSNSD